MEDLIKQLEQNIFKKIDETSKNLGKFLKAEISEVKEDLNGVKKDIEKQKEDIKLRLLLVYNVSTPLHYGCDTSSIQNINRNVLFSI